MQFREKARATLVLCLAIAGAALLLSGCQAPAPEPSPADPPTPAQRPDPYIVDPAEILALLDAAEAAMQREQLTYPAKGSALGLFDQVLAMDPGNAEAKRGLERIVEHYLQQAELAAQRNQLARARSMMDRARIVDASHPALAPTEIQLELLANAERDRLVLDGALLRSRSGELGQPLQQLGSRARAGNCRATIRARTDSEGRWVYQQMSLAPGDTRIRAQIQIGSPPLVELLCFQRG